jgi:predicted aspartyl protease
MLTKSILLCHNIRGGIKRMSVFKISVIAVNPKNEEQKSTPIDALVDTGSALSWIPEEILKKIDISPRRKKIFKTASGERIERQVGYAILRAEGYETIDELVFAEKGDMILLGVRTIEGFSVMVDNIGHRLVAQASLAS